MTIKQSLYQAEWLGLDKELREKLKDAFAINRSEGMKVINSKLVSDGCSQADLIEGITIGKMIEYVGETGNSSPEKLFDDLLKRSINKVEELNSNEKKDEQTTSETNTRAETESKGAEIKSEGDKQTLGDGDNRPSGDASVNASSGNGQDIQRPKTKSKSKRAGNKDGRKKGKKVS